MNRPGFLAMVLGFAACTQKGADTGGTEAALTGTITLDEMDGQAVVGGGEAFAYEADGRLVVFVSSHPESTCADAVAWFTRSQLDPFHPETERAVTLGGACSITLALTDYDPSGFAASRAADAEEFDAVAAATAIECAMGDGAFELSTSSTGDTDYYWTETWWVGVPTVYDWSISGGDGDDVVLDVRMSAYDGRLIYDPDSTPVVSASGTVQGVLNAAWCPEIGDTPIF